MWEIRRRSRERMLEMSIKKFQRHTVFLDVEFRFTSFYVQGFCYFALLAVTIVESYDFKVFEGGWWVSNFDRMFEYV